MSKSKFIMCLKESWTVTSLRAVISHMAFAGQVIADWLEKFRGLICKAGRFSIAHFQRRPAPAEQMP